MNKRVLILCILTFIVLLTAEINDPILAVAAGESDLLIYDQENGISRRGDRIYLTFFRQDFSQNNVYNLMCAYSVDNGNEFNETLITGFYNVIPELLYERKYAPTIMQKPNGSIMIFYTDLTWAIPRVAISGDHGSTFVIEDISLPPRSQYQILKNCEDVTLVSIEEENYERPLSSFQYFTMHEYSENDEYTETDRVKFWGPDVFWGSVHSNSDIWIQQAGGGNNNGWPTFHEMVTTNGRIMNHATGQPAVMTTPMDDVFQGGYQENTGILNMGDAIEIRANGYDLATSENRDICYVKIDGTTAVCRYADIITTRDTFCVYNSFPDPAHTNFPIGDSIWTNYVDVKTTVWDDNTFTLNIINSSIFVHCQLWIEGTISGFQTWGCEDTIYVTNDLLYESVLPGNIPQIGDPDLLGLVSEERIYIQYKNYDPDTGTIQSPNCDGIYLYGSFAALGNGNIELYGAQNTHYEGIFSYNYQHPHGSTPGFTLTYPNGTEWDVEYPDLHKFIFPPSPFWSGDPGFLLHGGNPIGFTCGYPYEDPNYYDPEVSPYGTDWPWYNPVYPEAADQTTMGERGIVHLFGGIQQYRRGFMHRSGTDPNNHQNNQWDIENWNYDGIHGSTGYDKDYHFDDRLYDIAPLHYPKSNNHNLSHTDFVDSSQLCIYAFDEDNLEATVIDSFVFSHNNFRLVDICHDDEKYAFLLIENPVDDAQVYVLQKIANNWELINIELSDVETIDYLDDNFVIKAGMDHYVFDQSGQYLPAWDMDEFSEFYDYTGIQGNILHYISETGIDQYMYHLNRLIEPDEFEYMGACLFHFPQFSDIIDPDIELYHKSSGEIVMQFLEESYEFEELYHYKNYVNIYIAPGNIAELPITEDKDLVITPQIEVYPNPFNPETNIQFNLDETCNVSLEVYNLKGQRIAVIVDEALESGTHNVIWNADNFSSGIYMLSIKTDSVSEWKKLILLK